MWNSIAYFILISANSDTQFRASASLDEYNASAFNVIWVLNIVEVITDSRKPKLLVKSQPHCHLIHHKSHVNVTTKWNRVSAMKQEGWGNREVEKTT
jgi:hypothetical protein